MSKENKSFSEYTDADFELESVNFYESFLASEESQAVEETQKEKVATKKDKRVVIDKAEYQFGPHKATFKPLTKTPSIQGKKVGTIVETQPVNFSFEDGFQLTTLGQWEKYGTAKFQSNKVILQGSEISYVGQMPGSNSVETGKAKCTQSGQKKDYEGIDTTDAAFPNYTSKAKVVQGYWAADEYGTRRLKEAELEQTVYFIIETVGINDGEQLQVQLWDYDYQYIPLLLTFLISDALDPDDPMDNGYVRTCVVKNNKAILKLYLKPQWEKEIDEDKHLFSNAAIELYCRVFHNNKSYDFPNRKSDYLNVYKGKDIYIKPIVAKNGYNYGIPEIYDYEGNPIIINYIDKIELIKEDYQEENYLKSLLISGGAYLADTKLSAVSKGIAIARLDSGYRVNQAGKVIRYDYWEQYLESKRYLRDGIPFERRTVKGLDRIAVMKSKNWITRKLYLVKNAANMFSSFYSLEELARGKGDMNSVLSDALVLSTNSTPILGILTKMTLDVLATPMSMFMKEWNNIDKRKMDSWKFEGIRNLERKLSIDPILIKKYKTHNISYQTMQGIIGKTIKKQENMKSANDEVTIVYSEVNDGILIDCFFVNIKSK